MTTHSMSTYETTQPWVCYHYGLTHDAWWPIWSSTHVLGRSRIRMECCVCGETEIASFRIPRFGPITPPASGRHPLREQFLAKHTHPDRGAPMSWARPLRNPAAFGPDGISLDALAMRLEADMRGRASDGGDL